MLNLIMPNSAVSHFLIITTVLTLAITSMLMPAMHNITFLSINARSLFNKMDELSPLVASMQPSILAVCETWASPHDPDSFYDIPNYSLHRHDRTDTRGGGVAVYIHTCIPHTHLSTLVMPNFQSVWLQLTPAAGPFTVACTYRPPSSDPRIFCQELEVCLAACNTHQPLVLLGDMNSKHTDWLASDATDRAGEALTDLIDIYGLKQHVSMPTHIHRGALGSCLDLVISNLDQDEVQVSSLAPIGQSDHLTLHGMIPLPTSSSHAENHTPNWHWSWEPRRMTSLKASLASAELLPPGDLGDHSIDYLWSSWRDSILQHAHRFCARPNNRYTPSSQPRRPWMTPELLENIRTKHKLYRQYLRSRTDTNWARFTAQRNATTRLLRDAKSTFVHASTAADPTLQCTSLNRPRLYKLIKGLRTSPPKELPTLSHNGTSVTNNPAKADAFNHFFIAESAKSVSPRDEPLPVIRIPPVEDRALTDIRTTPDEVQRLLQDLDPSKAAGHDNIPTRLLKAAAPELAPSLARLYNQSFQRGDQPQDWRDATVSPLHKKGSRSELSNYRPISLLSVVSKTQERIVHQRLYRHVEPLLPNDQSGFRAHDSTELQLTRLVHEISESRDHNLNVAACFFDLSKAFDRVWHKGLLQKLRHLGIKDTLLEWLRSYLTRRRQRVRVGTDSSYWLPIPAGVPQGSVLGPLLFLVYTIDLPAACTNVFTKCSQFADDTALIATHHVKVTAEGSLQSAVTSAADWLKEWHLLVNATKTVTMSFVPGHQLRVTLNGALLQQVQEHRHLGVIIQSDLRWSSHIDHITKKTKKLLHQLHKIRGNLNVPSLLAIYSTYIRPVLEYGSLVLSNLSQSQRDQLERIQRRAARICLRIPLFRPVHHSSLLHNLKIPTLSSRQTLRQVLLAYDIKHGSTPPHLQQPHLAPRTLQQPYSLRRIRTYTLGTPRTNRHRNSPLNSALHQFNKLPEDMQSMLPRTRFKSSASTLLLNSICSCSAHPQP